MLAHGFQTLIQTAPGAGLFPFVTEDSLMGFLEQSSRFLKPVFVGDTVIRRWRWTSCRRTEPRAWWGSPAQCTTAPGASAGRKAALPAAETAGVIPVPLTPKLARPSCISIVQDVR